MTTSNVCKISKALSDQNRLKIIKLLSRGEKCGCVLLEAFNITQPTLSHHMQILSECDLIKTRKEGKWMHYSLNKKTLQIYLDAINSILEQGKK